MMFSTRSPAPLSLGAFTRARRGRFPILTSATHSGCGWRSGRDGRRALKRNDFILESSSRFSFLFEHDLFRKLRHTFRDHALVTAAGARRALEPALHPRVLAHATSPPRSDVQPADKLRISRQFVSPALRRPSRNRAIGLAVYGTDCLTHATDRVGCSLRR